MNRNPTSLFNVSLCEVLANVVMKTSVCCVSCVTIIYMSDVLFIGIEWFETLRRWC